MFDLRSDGPEAAPAPRPGEAPDPAPARQGVGERAGEGPGERTSRPLDMPLFATAFAVRFGGPRAALECPKHLADVQGVIDRVSARLDATRSRMPRERAELVEALLDDARMLQEAARRNHERPIGPYDHARAFAKADAALGHARAAEILQSRCAQG